MCSLCCEESLFRMQLSASEMLGLPSAPGSGFHLAFQCSQGEPSFGLLLLQPRTTIPCSQPLGLSLPALRHCPLPSAVWRRPWVWTVASPGSCCLWGPLSTWTALPSMRLWQPSSLPKSTTTSSTWARSQLSGEILFVGPASS